jgi:hypothetical protein
MMMEPDEPLVTANVQQAAELSTLIKESIFEEVRDSNEKDLSKQLARLQENDANRVQALSEIFTEFSLGNAALSLQNVSLFDEPIPLEQDWMVLNDMLSQVSDHVTAELLKKVELNKREAEDGFDL